MTRDPELIDPRPDERLPAERLERYLRGRLPWTEGEFSLGQFGGGHANLTYLVRFGDVEYVLRRPPLGPVAPRAHDMGREFRVLSRLADHFALAPRSFLHCEDEGVIGAEFQVMERRDGRVIRKEWPADVGGDAGLVRRIGEMIWDVLADFHLVDRDAAGLGDLGRPEGFVERQLEGWARRWQAAAHEENRTMDRLLAWLRERRPHTRHVTLLHNDYKFDNLLVGHDDPARAVAVLDWDMCTSGDALTDVGYLLNQWPERDDPPEWLATTSMAPPVPGLPGREAAVERYARRTGFGLEDVHWYHAFSAMKFAVIIQQIFIRYHRGQTRDARFAAYDERARSYVRKGCAIAEAAP